jgi:DNA invertase Pin-like site-specific DNA recombinase
VVVVYKVDRLTRSLSDFAKLVELFDSQSVSFVSVRQSFNTTSSMGRLTLNVLPSFAQFGREVSAYGCTELVQNRAPCASRGSGCDKTTGTEPGIHRVASTGRLFLLAVVSTAR